MSGDATHPVDVGFPAKRKVDAIVSTHPNLMMMQEGEDEPAVNPGTVDLFANWMPQLKSSGIMVITTYFAEEAEAILHDPRLEKYVVLYGVTGVFDVSEMQSNSYIIVLRGKERAKGKSPVVWRNEDYEEFGRSSIRKTHRNISV